MREMKSWPRMKHGSNTENQKENTKPRKQKNTKKIFFRDFVFRGFVFLFACAFFCVQSVFHQWLIS